MHRITMAAVLIAAIGLFSAQIACGQSHRAAIEINHDRDTFISTVRVEATGGRVAWADVLRGVSRAQGYDDRALNGTLPDWSVKLDGFLARFVVSGMNRTLGQGVQARIAPPASPRGEPQLVIDINHEAVQASQRRAKRKLREMLLPDDYDGRRFGLTLIDPANDGEAQSQLVVFIHGLNSHPHTVRKLAAIAAEHGLATAEFNYPNDQSIEESGVLLSSELARWKREHPKQRVALVAHSMGGLVARVALEDPRLDPGNVDRLIMVATPNQGCALSQFAFGLDIWEYMDKGARDGKSLFYSSIEDGLSEATVDLQPNSIFLTKLNRRSRNPGVKYSNFLGTGGPCSREELNNVRRQIHRAGRYSPIVKMLGSKLDRDIADLDEVVEGFGDGAVAVKRGRLAGVEDTHVMGFGHLNVLFDSEDAEVQRLYAEVLKRLLEP